MVAAWIRGREPHDPADRITLDVAWPDGKRFRYIVTGQGIQAEAFATPARKWIARSHVPRIHLVEGPAGAVTVVGVVRGNRWQRWWRRFRAWQQRTGTAPLDDAALGTAVGSLDVERLASDLTRLGYDVRRMTWQEALAQSA